MIVEDIGHGIAILPVSFLSILDAPNAANLLRAYAKECSVPNAEPQRAIYAAMEQAGVLHCFAAYDDLDGAPSPLLIGFCSIVAATMPHTGQRIATTESLFVDPVYRHTGAANALLLAVEQHAAAIGCSDITATARVGSAFEKVLSHRIGYRLTHSQHTRRLT